MHVKDIKRGGYARHHGDWAFVAFVEADGSVWLSGWRGIKTTVVDVREIDAFKEEVDAGEDAGDDSLCGATESTVH